MSLALVVNGTSSLGRAAVEALRGAGLLVEIVNGSNEADWAQALATYAEGVDTIIVAQSGEGPCDDPQPAITAAWLGAKYALPVFRARGSGTLLTLGFAPGKDSASPGQDAACESIRLLTVAALHDARAAGIALRSNRLFVDPDADPGALRETIRFLADRRSQFMSGAELSLAAGTAPESAQPDLAGKAILVTGATSGIGRSVAIEIGRQGGFAFVGGRKLDLAEETLTLVRAAGGDGLVVPLDVTSAAAWREAAERIKSVRGLLHGLVNNAGEAKNAPIEQLDEDDLAVLSAINIRGVRLGMDAMETLLAQGRGCVINIASVAGVRAGPGGSAYSATKAAMVGLSRGYAAAYARAANPIRVNSVQPGLIWSASVADSLGEDGARRFRAMIEPKTPLGRVGLPEEVAGPVAFLLSDAAAAITGQAINVSGGLELGWP